MSIRMTRLYFIYCLGALFVSRLHIESLKCTSDPSFQGSLSSHASTSDLLSIIKNKGVVMTLHIIYPSDPTNATKITQTKALLITTYGNAAVQQSRDENNRTNWHLTSKRDDLQAEIRQLDGICRVARENEDILWSISTAKPPGVKPGEDVRKYMVAATEGSDTQKTEELLKGKVEPGTSFTRFKRDGGVVRGWGLLALGLEAKRVVQGHEGVDGDLLVDSVSRC